MKGEEKVFLDLSTNWGGGSDQHHTLLQGKGPRPVTVQFIHTMKLHTDMTLNSHLLT